MIETLIASAGIPIVGDLIKRIANKYIGPSIDSEADTKKLQALAELDSVGETYKWVNAVRGLMRPMAGFTALGIWGFATFDVTMPEHVYNITCQVAGAVIFYLFGERTNMYLNRK